MLLSALFFMIPSGRNNKNKMPKGSNPQNSNPDNLKDILDKIGSSSGDIFNKPGNLDKISSLISTLSDSNSKVKMGHLIIELVSHISKSLFNDLGGDGGIIHYNDDLRTSQCKIFKTNVYMGRNHNKKLMSYINGPTWEVVQRRIFDSTEDAIDIKNGFRKDLTTTSGVNQRSYCFLGEATYLSLEDINTMTNYSDSKKILEGELSRFIKLFTKNKEDKIDKVEGLETILDFDFKKLTGKNNNKINFKRHYAGFLSTKLVLKILNKLPVYSTTVLVHLVRFDDSKTDIRTIPQLLEEIQGEKNSKDKSFIERLNPAEVYEFNKPNPKFKFNYQLNTALNVNITGLESFQDHCTVLKTWKRKLDSGDYWYLTINEKFQNGIYLNYLHELNKTIPKSELSSVASNTFIIIESFGDRRASVYRKADNETINGVYSPTCLSHEVKLSVNYLTNNDTILEENNFDSVLQYTTIKKDDSFEDEELALEFYPNRVGKFNINSNNIEIGTEEKQKSQFRLELSASILENQEMSRMEKFFAKMAKSEPESSLNEDDTSFMSKMSGMGDVIDDDDPDLLDLDEDKNSGKKSTK